MAAEKGSESRSANQTKLELAGDREIVMERTFNGPARIVFDAWTRADLVRRWWAPRALGVSMVSCEADVRVGGKYRYVIAHQAGEELGFSGEYVEMTPPSRLVYTQVFEPMSHAGKVTVTVTFEEREGKTRLVSREVYPSKEVREAVVASGMEKGARMTMDQLEELIATLV